jgi:hypothetical protein
MKTKFTLLAVLVALFVTTKAQQIPNGSFEAWTNPLAPDSWATFDQMFNMSLGLSFNDTVNKVVGNSSLKLVSDSIPGQPSYGVVSGIASLGSGSITVQGPSFVGIPFSFRPDTFFFAYKFTQSGLDTAGISLGLKKLGNYLLLDSTAPVWVSLTNQPSWKMAYVSLDAYYLNANTPDTLEIQAVSSIARITNKGTTFNIDGLYFGYTNLPNALQEIAEKLQIVIFPNPASNTLNITSESDIDNYKVILTDVNGNIVYGTLFSSKHTIIDVSTLSSGTYICRIADQFGNILKSKSVSIAK